MFWSSEDKQIRWDLHPSMIHSCHSDMVGTHLCYGWHHQAMYHLLPAYLLRMRTPTGSLLQMTLTRHTCPSLLTIHAVCFPPLAGSHLVHCKDHLLTFPLEGLVMTKHAILEINHQTFLRFFCILLYIKVLPTYCLMVCTVLVILKTWDPILFAFKQ